MIDIVEYDVAEAGVVDGILGGQSDAAGADDDDNAVVKSRRSHQSVDAATHSAKHAVNGSTCIDLAHLCCSGVTMGWLPRLVTGGPHC